MLLGFDCIIAAQTLIRNLTIAATCISIGNVNTILQSDGTGNGPEVREAARLLDAGEIVAFPTETVYALAAAATLPDSLARLAETKRRPAERKFAVLVADLSAVWRHVPSVPDAACRLMERFWPGPFTIVLPTPDGGTVGLRMPDHALARAIVRATTCGVAATSANISGEREVNTASEIASLFGDTVKLIIEGGAPLRGRASTVVQFERSGWRLLRQGDISHEDIRRVLGVEPLHTQP
jgi:L-threonylcarbamoyladenylate synthase